MDLLLAGLMAVSLENNEADLMAALTASKKVELLASVLVDEKGEPKDDKLVE